MGAIVDKTTINRNAGSVHGLQPSAIHSQIKGLSSLFSALPNGTLRRALCLSCGASGSTGSCLLVKLSLGLHPGPFLPTLELLIFELHSNLQARRPKVSTERLSLLGSNPSLNILPQTQTIKLTARNIVGSSLRHVGLILEEPELSLNNTSRRKINISV